MGPQKTCAQRLSPPGPALRALGHLAFSISYPGPASIAQSREGTRQKPPPVGFHVELLSRASEYAVRPNGLRLGKRREPSLARPKMIVASPGCGWEYRGRSKGRVLQPGINDVFSAKNPGAVV